MSTQVKKYGSILAEKHQKNVAMWEQYSDRNTVSTFLCFSPDPLVSRRRNHRHGHKYKTKQHAPRMMIIVAETVETGDVWYRFMQFMVVSSRK